MTTARLEEIRGLIKDGQYSDFDLGELLQACDSLMEKNAELKAELKACQEKP